MKMHVKDAQLIREWRSKGATWRRISERAAQQWPDKQYETDNLLEGRELCAQAASLLCEDINTPPWN